MKIFHWVPSAERPAWPCIESWLNMKLPEGAEREFFRSRPNNAKYSWNDAVIRALDSGADWLFSTHSDVVYTPDTLLRLLSWDEPLISALIFMRQSPVVPHIWKKYDDDPSGRMVQRINDTRDWFLGHKEWIRFGPFVMDPKPLDAIVPVCFTSTSCTLIHRKVLEDMRPLVNDIWFQWDDDLRGGGEDRRFFEFAKQAGYTPQVDRSCVVGHIPEDVATSAADFMAWDAVSTFNNTGEQIPPVSEQ